MNTFLYRHPYLPPPPSLPHFLQRFSNAASRAILCYNALCRIRFATTQTPPFSRPKWSIHFICIIDFPSSCAFISLLPPSKRKIFVPEREMAPMLDHHCPPGTPTIRSSWIHVSPFPVRNPTPILSLKLRNFLRRIFWEYDSAYTSPIPPHSLGFKSKTP